MKRQQLNHTICNFPDTLDMFSFGFDKKYRLIANIVFDSNYKIHVRHKELKKWFLIHDLQVEEILVHMIRLSESCIQVLYY